MASITIEDFEDGDASEYYNLQSGEDISAVTNPVYEGNYSGELYTEGVFPSAIRDYQDAYQPFTIQAYVRWDSSNDHRPGISFNKQDGSGGHYNIFGIQFDKYSNETILTCGNNNSGDTIQNSVPASNTWHQVRFTNIDWSNGTFDFVLNRNTIATNKSFCNTSVSEVDSLWLVANGGSTATSYYDEVQYLGVNLEGNVTASQPIARGSGNTATTVGDFSDWKAFQSAEITSLSNDNRTGDRAERWKIDASIDTDNFAGIFDYNRGTSYDFSQALGTTSGGFTQGCFGVHMQLEDKSILDPDGTLQVQIGSSSLDYAEWELDRSELGEDGSYTYYTFPASEATINGSPDWTSVDFMRLIWYPNSIDTGSTFLLMDFFTVSSRDNVGAIGVGDRKSDKKTIRSG